LRKAYRPRSILKTKGEAAPPTIPIFARTGVREGRKKPMQGAEFNGEQSAPKKKGPKRES